MDARSSCRRSTPGAAKEPPRLAAKFWDEYSGKQLLENFSGDNAMVGPIIDPDFQTLL